MLSHASVIGRERERVIARALSVAKAASATRSESMGSRSATVRERPERRQSGDLYTFLKEHGDLDRRQLRSFILQSRSGSPPSPSPCPLAAPSLSRN